MKANSRPTASWYLALCAGVNVSAKDGPRTSAYHVDGFAASSSPTRAGNDGDGGHELGLRNIDVA